MATQPLPETGRTGTSWLSDWKPEESAFWEAGGKATAWKTLWVTTYCLLLAFATWFVVSAVLVRLTGIGFKLDKGQLFWLAGSSITPPLLGGPKREPHLAVVVEAPIESILGDKTVSSIGIRQEI